MVRRYNPTMDEIWHPYEQLPEIKLSMEECATGEYVKLETYINECKRLQRQIERYKLAANVASKNKLNSS